MQTHNRAMPPPPRAPAASAPQRTLPLVLGTSWSRCLGSGGQQHYAGSLCRGQPSLQSFPGSCLPRTPLPEPTCGVQLLF